MKLSVFALVLFSSVSFGQTNLPSDPVMSAVLIHCDFEVIEDGIKRIKFADVSSDDTGKSDLAVLVSGYADEARDSAELDIGHLKGGGMPAEFTSKNPYLSRRLEIKAQDASFISEGKEAWGAHKPWREEYIHGKCSHQYQESIGAHNK